MVVPHSVLPPLAEESGIAVLEIEKFVHAELGISPLVARAGSQKRLTFAPFRILRIPNPEVVLLDEAGPQLALRIDEALPILAHAQAQHDVAEVQVVQYLRGELGRKVRDEVTLQRRLDEVVDGLNDWDWNMSHQVVEDVHLEIGLQGCESRDERVEGEQGRQRRVDAAEG